MIVCKGCAKWVKVNIDYEAEVLFCDACGFAEPVRILPLFVVTGPSGAGKTEVIPHLRRLLPEFDIFETDVMWDSGGDWHFVRQNWLRVAFSIAQSGRAVILCGTHLPEHLDQCDFRPFFRSVHYVALLCEETLLESRLRARPAWRKCDAMFIAEHVAFSHWLRENAHTAFSPPLTLVDTTCIAVPEVAERIREWIEARMGNNEYKNTISHGCDG